MSDNPLAEAGLIQVMEMVRRNDSLTSLNVSRCKLNCKGLEKFSEALRLNSKIRKFFVHDNGIAEDLYNIITAETDANALLISLKTNPQSIDANTLTEHVLDVFYNCNIYHSYENQLFYCRYICLFRASCVFSQVVC